MLDSREPNPTATRRRASEQADMSQQCSYCGDIVPVDEWHPVATVRDDHDDVEILTFCSDGCRSAWSADRE